MENLNKRTALASNGSSEKKAWPQYIKSIRREDGRTENWENREWKYRTHAENSQQKLWWTRNAWSVRHLMLSQHRWLVLWNHIRWISLSRRTSWVRVTETDRKNNNGGVCCIYIASNPGMWSFRTGLLLVALHRMKCLKPLHRGKVAIHWRGVQKQQTRANSCIKRLKYGQEQQQQR